jgi:type II secretory pathway component PulF
MSVTSEEVGRFANTAGDLMLHGHGSFIACLRAAKEDQTSPDFRDVLDDVLGRITQGVALSAAMGEFPDVFSPDLIEQIRQGERSGRLEEMMSNAHP